MVFALSANDIAAGAAIPPRFTCQGEDISPSLAWSGVPDQTKSFVLIVEDPDAPSGLFTHWVIFNIPPGLRSLREGASPHGQLPSGSSEGKNDMGKLGYSGPCPPSGKPHHYHFKLYALCDNLSLKSGANRAQVLAAIKGLTLGETELVAIYQRA